MLFLLSGGVWKLSGGFELFFCFLDGFGRPL